MNLVFLAVLAIAQAVFIVMLLVTLVLGRILRARSLAHEAAESEALALEAFRRVAARTDGHALLAGVESARMESVIGMLQRVGSQTRGPGWERLVRDVRGTAWFAALERRTRSRLWWRRLAATHAFAEIALPEDAPLIEALSVDPHPVVRLASVSILKRVTTPRLVETALEIAGTPQSVVRRFVIDTLTRTGALDVQSLADRLHAPRDGGELRLLLDVASILADPRLLAAVLSHARSEDVEIRIAVARVAGRIPHRESVRALFRLLEDPEWPVRAQAAAGLGVVGSSHGLRPLIRRLEDPSWWVRLRAALSLRRIGPVGEAALRAVDPAKDPYAWQMARYAMALSDSALAEFGGHAIVDYSEAAPPRAA